MIQLTAASHVIYDSLFLPDIIQAKICSTLGLATIYLASPFTIPPLLQLLIIGPTWILLSPNSIWIGKSNLDLAQTAGTRRWVHLCPIAVLNI